MARPTGGDYLAAFQNPRTAFSETFLQSASPAKNRLGLPNLMTGNFAAVCNMHSSTDAWAVRCFLRDIPDLHVRYQAISEYLEPRREEASSIVGFRYIPDGIRVKDEWHPIVIMDWVDGDPLDRAIDDLIA